MYKKRKITTIGEHCPIVVIILIFPGREITTIFLSSIHQTLQTGYNASICSDPGIQQVKDTLIEGHAKVNGLKIYALFAVNDINVGERDYVPWVVWYNSNCASGTCCIPKYFKF
jgi:hypothetical protein